MIEELYQRWLNHPHIDPQLKKELAGMSEKRKAGRVLYEY